MGCWNSKPPNRPSELGESPPASRSPSMRQTGIEGVSFPGALVEKYDIISLSRADGIGGEFKVRENDGLGSFRAATLMAIKETGDGKKSSMTTAHVQSAAYALEVLQHDNVAKLYDCIIEKKGNRGVGAHVTELAAGGSVFEELVRLGTFGESDARAVLVQVAQALKYAHEQGVVCGSLNLETIGYKTEAKDKVILTSFRYSSMVGQPADFKWTYGKYENEDETGALQERTYPCQVDLAYISPELLKPGDKRRTPANDVWAFGVIMYTMFSGYNPFMGEGIPEMCENIRLGNFTSFLYDTETWDGISKAAKDLISVCLRVSTKKRYSMARVLAHPWFGLEGSVLNSASNLALSLRTETTSDSYSAQDDGSDGEEYMI